MNNSILQRLRSRPKRPFWKLPQHRLPVLSLYKTLLKISKKFPEDIHRKYLFYSIRDKFRVRRHETSVTNTIEFLKEAKECRNTLLKALNGDVEAFQHIDDLTWGRKGSLKEILTWVILFHFDIDNYFKEAHACIKIKLRTKKWKKRAKSKRGILRVISDTRTKASRMKDSHRAYKIPLDRRLYSPPRVQLIIKSRMPKKKKHFWRTGLVRHRIITQLGYRLQRIRGWRQPTWISMMMNKRINQHNKRLERYNLLESYLEMVRAEVLMMRQLDPKLATDVEGFEKLIIQEMTESKKYHERMLKLKAKSQLDDS
ncbi:4783_t:CDS:2 [Acaulospora morrowiae]|uniref:4783_t:CDS:1 n=1 Tax=Acaulospora morrowiae TaxID=94023 RepID=A0A9N8VNJ1_9GLOM|nr:4783_t:CDS:2 [Acaulospora morrowiae]